jgi:hypothetical protein
MAVPCWCVRCDEANDMVGIGCRLRARGRRSVGMDPYIMFKIGRLTILDVGAVRLNGSIWFTCEDRISHVTRRPKLSREKGQIG